MSKVLGLPWWLKLVNPVVAALNRLELAIGTQHILTVRGRTSGRHYSTPVSLLTVRGARYIATFPWTGWAKNARADGRALLSRGRRTEHVVLIEVPLEERARILREFPRQVPHGVHFFRLPADPEAFARAAPELAVFRIGRHAE